MINSKKLDFELKEAGIPILGCNDRGMVWFKDLATQAQRELAVEIIKRHRVVWYVEERQKRYPPIGDQLDAIYKWAKAQSFTIPGFTDVIDKIKADWPKE